MVKISPHGSKVIGGMDFFGVGEGGTKAQRHHPPQSNLYLYLIFTKPQNWFQNEGILFKYPFKQLHGHLLHSFFDCWVWKIALDFATSNEWGVSMKWLSYNWFIFKNQGPSFHTNGHSIPLCTLQIIVYYFDILVEVNSLNFIYREDKHLLYDKEKNLIYVE